MTPLPTEYAETLNWLLEDNAPWVRYNTLINVVDRRIDEEVKLSQL